MCGHGTRDGAVFVDDGGRFVKRQRVDCAMRGEPQSDWRAGAKCDRGAARTSLEMRAEHRTRRGDVRERRGQRERMAVEMTRQVRREDSVAIIGEALAPCDGRRIETRSAMQYEEGGPRAAARRNKASREARAVSGDDRGARPFLPVQLG